MSDSGNSDGRDIREREGGNQQMRASSFFALALVTSCLSCAESTQHAAKVEQHVDDPALLVGFREEAVPSPDPAFTSFGSGLALLDDTALIGIPEADSSRGEVRIFKRGASGWAISEQVLRPRKDDVSEAFGSLITASGNMVAVAGTA